MTTFAHFAVKMGRLAADVSTVTPRDIAGRAAFEVKTSVQNQLKVAAPKGRLNVGKKGQRIGVRYTLGTTSARVFMFGPAHLIESDTKAHRIPRATVGRGKRTKANRKVIVIPGVGVRQSAQHPGTRGKHPWAKGLVAGLARATRAGGDVYFDTIRKAIR